MTTQNWPIEDGQANDKGSQGAGEGETLVSDDAALDAQQWVDRYGDSLFRFAIAKTGDRSLAEDLVQETFLAAVSAKSGFRNQATVCTWLFAILKRKIADHFRSQLRRACVSDLGTENLSSEAHLRGTPSMDAGSGRTWKADPAKICQDREFWIALDECVDKLPSKLSEVFILREINQQTPKEIRELLGVSATNLSMRLHRCRLAVRDCLNKNWFREDS